MKAWTGRRAAERDIKKCIIVTFITLLTWKDTERSVNDSSGVLAPTLLVNEKLKESVKTSVVYWSL